MRGLIFLVNDNLVDNNVKETLVYIHVYYDLIVCLFVLRSTQWGHCTVSLTNHTFSGQA